jgi:hypothetical protein
MRLSKKKVLAALLEKDSLGELRSRLYDLVTGPNARIQAIIPSI